MNIACFGEVLWDVFPDKKRLGGAPLNVSLRLHSFGNNVSIISSVGNDKDGNEIITFLENNALSTDYIQRSTNYNTGKVKVSINQLGNASYEIIEPVAWDDIKMINTLKACVKESNALVFGSLTCRNKTSYNTLLQLLPYSKFNVFDVNIRYPYYSIDTLKRLFDNVDFLKMNEEEYPVIFRDLGFTSTTVQADLKTISSSFNIKSICLTKGKDGAILFHNNQFFHSPSYKVEVKDTVGAGDSFLATLLHHLLINDSPEKALQMASAVGALVASKSGANAKLTNKEIHSIIE